MALPASLQALVDQSKRDWCELERLAQKFGYQLVKVEGKPRYRVPCWTQPHVPADQSLTDADLDEILAGLDAIR